MYMDKITEAIAHFIGLFEITLEQARLRKAYEEFTAERALSQEAPDLPNLNVNVKAPQEFVGFEPDLPYQPVPPELVKLVALSSVDFRPPEVPEADGLNVVAYPGFIHPASSAPASPGPVVQLTLEPPAAVAVVISQEIGLSDNDYVAAGGHGLVFNPVDLPGVQLTGLLQAASALSPIDEAEVPGSKDEMVDFISTVTEQLRTYPETAVEQPTFEEGEANVFVLKAHNRFPSEGGEEGPKVIEGTFVNGKLVEEAPLLEDYLPNKPDDKQEDEEEAPTNGPKTATGQLSPGEGAIVIDASVELEAGGNTLVNSVALTSNMLGAPVFAVVGDNVELNAIVQTNVWSDSDLVSSAIGGWKLDSGNPTQGLNIATFQRIDPSPESGEASTAAGNFPKHWAVTEITGDLMIANWIEQFTFMADNDVAVLSSSGVETTVTTGANTAVNDISLEELGHYYDVVVVGGNIYDANLIQQTNVLLDNDLIGAVDDFETAGEGSVSTHGNLLWNQAAILNVGRADRFEALPEHYREAAESLAAGNRQLNDQVLQDDAFAGMGAIRALHISGDIVNLQYIKQTTILGDSDQVALAMNALKAHPEADWTLNTGSNALVNYAAILDVDATGKTYVGGQHYSDDFLIQAELISSDPDLGGRDPDALVNEAVAFLGDDMLTPDHGPQLPQHGHLVPDASQADVMQSMLA